MQDGNESETGNFGKLFLIAKQTAIVCLVAGGVVLTLLGLATAIDVVLMLFMGILVAIFLHSLAAKFDEYTHCGATLSLIATNLLLLLVVVVSGWLLVPTISIQVGEFQERWPALISKASDWLHQTPSGEWILSLLPDLDHGWPRPRNLVSRVSGVASSAIGGLGVLIMVVSIGLMLAAQPSLYQEGCISLVPPSRRKRATEILAKLGSTLRWWLIAKVSAMVVVGVLTWAGLMLLGVELAATLGVLAAVLTFVPNFGPIIAAVPAVLLALMHSPVTAMWVVLLYIVVQLLESFVVTPLIQYRALSLPPVLVIFAQLALSSWVGLWGLALATPLLAMAMVLVRQLYIGDLLHESPEKSAH